MVEAVVAKEAAEAVAAQAAMRRSGSASRPGAEAESGAFQSFRRPEILPKMVVCRWLIADRRQILL